MMAGAPPLQFVAGDVVSIRADPCSPLMVVAHCRGVRTRCWWTDIHGQRHEAWFDTRGLMLDPSNARTGNN